MTKHQQLCGLWSHPLGNVGSKGTVQSTPRPSSPHSRMSAMEITAQARRHPPLETSGSHTFANSFQQIALRQQHVAVNGKIKSLSLGGVL